MMDSRSIDRIKHISNGEVVRRLLIQYFITKGFNNSFDRQIYPSLLQDIGMALPMLSSKIEIVPYAAELDPALGKAVLGWNLFVLGTHRMFLGETYHNNLSDLARQIRSGIITSSGGYGTARRQTTPRKIITFIARVLSTHEHGYVDLNPITKPIRQPGEPYAGKAAMMGMPQSNYGRAMRT